MDAVSEVRQDETGHVRARHVRVLLLSNPQALELPDIRALYKRAFESGPVTPEKAMAHLVPGDPSLGILAGREGEEYRALAVLINARHPLVETAQIYNFYSKGSVHLRRAMIAGMVALSKAWGYSGMSVRNHIGSDAAFMRLFRDAGKGSVGGTIIDFDFEE